MALDYHKHCQKTVLSASGLSSGQGATWSILNELTGKLRNLPPNWIDYFKNNTSNITEDFGAILKILNIMSSDYVKKIKVNDKSNLPDGDGEVNLGKIVKSIQLNRNDYNPNTNGIVNLGELVKQIILNNQPYNPTNGIVNLGNVLTDDSNYVKRSGDTMTGFLTLHAHPIEQFHAATKQYVDSKTAGFGTGSVNSVTLNAINHKPNSNGEVDLGSIDVPSLSVNNEDDYGEIISTLVYNGNSNYIKIPHTISDNKPKIVVPDYENATNIGIVLFGDDKVEQVSDQYQLKSNISKSTQFPTYKVPNNGYIITHYMLTPDDTNKSWVCEINLYVTNKSSILVSHWDIRSAQGKSFDCHTQIVPVAKDDLLQIKIVNNDNIKFKYLNRTYFVPCKYADVENNNTNPNLDSIFDMIYPIGSIYISMSATEIPQTFRGIWERIASGKTLWSASDSAIGKDLAGVLPEHMHSYEKANSANVQAGSFGYGVTGSTTVISGQVSLSSQVKNITVGNTLRPPSIAVSMWKRIS